jgi:L-iditol 2-dehydrogenase
MKSMVLTEYKRLELKDMPLPDVGPGDVRIRVHACGICGSDVHGFDGSSGRRIPPLIMGHEAAGTVESVGDSVQGFGPGDRVTFDSMISCGTCHFCQAGQINLCDRRRVVGVSPGEWRQHGAFAELGASSTRRWSSRCRWRCTQRPARRYARVIGRWSWGAA